MPGQLLGWDRVSNALARVNSVQTEMRRAMRSGASVVGERGRVALPVVVELHAVGLLVRALTVPDDQRVAELADDHPHWAAQG